MDAKQKVEFLRQSDLLKDTDEQILIEIAEYCDIAEVSTGYTILEFHPRDRIYAILLYGRTKLMCEGELVGEFAGQTFTGGFLFSETDQRSYSLLASMPTLVLVFRFFNSTMALLSENQLLRIITRYISMVPESETDSCHTPGDEPSVFSTIRRLKNTQNHLFSIFNHDLRSPVATLLSISEILTGEAEEDNMDMVRQLLPDFIDLLGVHMRMLDDLKKWARLRAGLERCSFEPVNLIHCIKDILQKEQYALEAKKLQVILDLNEIPLVITDSYLVKSILAELISNARKYSYTGGKITVCAGLEVNHIFVLVQDEGKGIRPAMIPELFRTGKNRTDYGTENEHGTGLGLLIAKEIALILKGNITVENGNEKGATFTLWLPVDSQQEQAFQHK